MNGKNLFLGMSYIHSKYIEEAETVTELKGETRHLSLRRSVMVAALVAMLLLLVGCAVAYANGWFTELFTARNGSQLSPDQVEFIQEKEQVFAETKSASDWTVELKSTMTDGKTGYILFGITAPEDIDLEGYDAASKEDLDAPYITPGNHSWSAKSARSYVVISTGFFNEEQNLYWSESGHWEPDNDGIPNTLNFMIELRCEKAYPNREQKLQDPFGKDVTFTARFFDFVLEYEDPEVRESIEARLAAEGDSLIGGEDMKGLHKSETLAEGEWIFDIAFAESRTETLELITEPVMVTAQVVHRIDNGTMFYDTRWEVEQIPITSFILSPMGAEVMYEEPEDSNGVFLEWENTEKTYVVMKDGTRTQLHSGGNGYTWSAKVPIVLENVSHVLLPDGTRLEK